MGHKFNVWPNVYGHLTYSKTKGKGHNVVSDACLCLTGNNFFIYYFNPYCGLMCWAEQVNKPQLYQRQSRSEYGAVIWGYSKEDGGFKTCKKIFYPSWQFNYICKMSFCKKSNNKKNKTPQYLFIYPICTSKVQFDIRQEVLQTFIKNSVVNLAKAHVQGNKGQLNWRFILTVLTLRLLKSTKWNTEQLCACFK